MVVVVVVVVIVLVLVLVLVLVVLVVLVLVVVVVVLLLRCRLLSLSSSRCFQDHLIAWCFALSFARLGPGPQPAPADAGVATWLLISSCRKQGCEDLHSAKEIFDLGGGNQGIRLQRRSIST